MSIACNSIVKDLVKQIGRLNSELVNGAKLVVKSSPKDNPAYKGDTTLEVTQGGTNKSSQDAVELLATVQALATMSEYVGSVELTGTSPLHFNTEGVRGTLKPFVFSRFYAARNKDESDEIKRQGKLYTQSSVTVYNAGVFAKEGSAEASLSNAILLTDKEYAYVEDTQSKLGTALGGSSDMAGINPQKFQSLAAVNPAMYYLFNRTEDGSYVINSNVALAVREGATEVLLQQSTRPDRDEEANIPFGSEDGFADQAGSAYFDISVGAKEVGRRIKQKLGLRVDPEFGGKEDDLALEAGLGLYGLMYLSESGYVQKMDGTDSETTLEQLIESEVNESDVVAENRIKGVTAKVEEDLTKGGKVIYKKILDRKIYPGNKMQGKELYQTMREIEDELEELSEISEIEENVSKPRFEPVERSSLKVQNQKHTKATKEQLEQIQIQEGSAYNYNSGMEVLVELLGDKDAVLAHLKAKKKLGNDKDMSLDTKESNKGKERSLEKEVNSLFDFYEDSERKDRPFYFEWFLAKNNRQHIKSSTLDPQTQKLLSRFLVSNVGMKADVAKSDVVDAIRSEEDFNKASDDVKIFVLGVVQGLEDSKVGGTAVGSVDKINTAELVSTVNRILDATDSELQSAVLESSHLGHGALALANVRKFAKAEGTFEMDAIAEFDGKTNGLAYNLLQMPTGGYKDLLKNVGILPEEAIENSLSEATWDDTYETMGSLLSKGFGDHVDEMESKVADSRRLEYANLRATDPNAASRAKLLYDMDFVLPTEKGSKLKSALRNFAKPIVMVVMYGSELRSIVSKLAKEIEPKVYDAIASGQMTDSRVAKLLEVEVGEVEEIRRNLREHLVDSKINKETQRKVSNAVFVMTDLPVREAVEDMFGPQMAIIRKVNESMTMRHQLALEVIDQELAGNSNYTEQEYNKLVQTLIELVPSINAPNTSNNSERLVFSKKGLSSDRTRDESIYAYAPITDVAKIGSLQGAKVTHKDKLRTLRANLLEETLDAPGASTGPLSVHTMDSTDLGKTITRMSDEMGVAPLGVFDALVVGAGMLKAVQVYNESFYETNRTYSLMQEYVDSYARAVDVAKEFMPDADVDNIKMSWDNMVMIPQSPEDVPTVAGILEGMMGVNDEIQTERSRIFSTKHKVGQMVGPIGTMAHPDPESANRLSESAIIEQMKVIKKLIQRNPEKYQAYREKFAECFK